MSWQITKLGYSSNPWRLVTGDGKEIAIEEPFDHPSMGRVALLGPIRSATRKGVEDQALMLLEQLWNQRKELKAPPPGGLDPAAAITPTAE